jgi:hypothetical protein
VQRRARISLLVSMENVHVSSERDLIRRRSVHIVPYHELCAFEARFEVRRATGFLFQIRGFQGGDYKECRLLGRDTRHNFLENGILPVLIC